MIGHLAHSAKAKTLRLVCYICNYGEIALVSRGRRRRDGEERETEGERTGRGVRVNDKGKGREGRYGER